MEGCSTLLLVCDLTSSTALASLQEWLDVFKANSSSGFIAGAVVGTKSDAAMRRAFTREDVESFAAKAGLAYFETSAVGPSRDLDALTRPFTRGARGSRRAGVVQMTNIDVEAPFQFLAEKVMEVYREKVVLFEALA
jgi:hypothetical protein